ncbi:hypothetical protein TNCV_2339481 [Trichonephila clavipes]|nr:hypothetical protein TNCV_2339481 [Trichonephila clavipes]
MTLHSTLQTSASSQQKDFDPRQTNFVSVPQHGGSLVAFGLEPVTFDDACHEAVTINSKLQRPPAILNPCTFNVHHVSFL